MSEEDLQWELAKFLGVMMKIEEVNLKLLVDKLNFIVMVGENQGNSAHWLKYGPIFLILRDLTVAMEPVEKKFAEARASGLLEPFMKPAS